MMIRLVIPLFLQKTLPTGSRALLAYSETLPPGSRTHPAGPRDLPAGSEALSAGSKALPAGSTPLPALLCRLSSPTGPLLNHY